MERIRWIEYDARPYGSKVQATTTVTVATAEELKPRLDKAMLDLRSAIETEVTRLRDANG